MKKITLIALSLVAASTLQAAVSGYLYFDNVYFDPDVLMTIGVGGNPADGAIGAYLGSDYTASLYWANGTISDTNMFVSSATLDSAVNT